MFYSSVTDGRPRPRRTGLGDPQRVFGWLALWLLVAWALPGVAALPPQSAAEVEETMNERWTGDLAGMAERNHIRALVVYSKTYYFLDGAVQRGLSYEALKEFEKAVNAHFKRPKSRPIQMVFIPVGRNELFSALAEGRGDIAAANLTVTPEREKLVDFADPWVSDAREILVTGTTGPELAKIEDLAGQEVYVRRSSSYYESLVALNQQFAKDGRKPVQIQDADELLEDEDLLEMVNAGLLPAVVVDEHKAEFWADIFPEIRLHKDIAVRTGGSIAWAIRKDSPELKQFVNAFVKKNRRGTLTHNVLLKRYLKTNKWARNATSERDRKRFQATLDLFRKYADQYDFDWIVVAAQAYQESGLDQNLRSPAGAVGVMQLLPSTAADPNVGIKDINKIENNIHAGAKYMRFIMDQYFADEPMDRLNKGLFAAASYNAGPARVRSLRQKAAKRGLDPNLWFHNVELIAAEDIGQETVQYVSNIYKYYLAYKLIYERAQAYQQARQKALAD